MIGFYRHHGVEYDVQLPADLWARLAWWYVTSDNLWELV